MLFRHATLLVNSLQIISTDTLLHQSTDILQFTPFILFVLDDETRPLAWDWIVIFVLLVQVCQVCHDHLPCLITIHLFHS